MSIIIDDIADYLEDQGVGTVGTNIFVGEQPNDPANCVTVIDTGGMRPDIDLPTKKPTFQVLVRNTEYSAGAAKLLAIRNILHNKYNAELVDDGNYFYSINAISEGGHIGKDDIGNDEFSMNFEAWVR